MNKRFTTLTITIIGIVGAFLIVEWYRPTNSLALFLSMVMLSVVGFALSIYGFKRRKSKLSILLLIIGALFAGLLILCFATMFIMGLGA